MHIMVLTKLVPHSGRSIVGPTMRWYVRSWLHVRSFESTKKQDRGIADTTGHLNFLVGKGEYFYNRIYKYIYT